jgi:hypothetical protein
VPLVEDHPSVFLHSRSGDHHSVVYNGAGCSGNTIDTVVNFGCGGVCHSVSNIQSVLLVQEGTGNPKPTAQFFSDGDCKNSIQSAGIFRGEHSGCTSMSQTANSYYLYFDC